MQSIATDIPQADAAVEKARPGEPPFGANEMRLNAWEWLVTVLIAAAALVAIPRVWKSHEPFTTGPDYRIPYALSPDYWLFQRRLDQLSEKSNIPIIGDSVVWGEYVRADGTLSHFLNQQAAESTHFQNCGVNGLYPLA